MGNGTITRLSKWEDTVPVKMKSCLSVDFLALVKVIELADSQEIILRMERCYDDNGYVCINKFLLFADCDHNLLGFLIKERTDIDIVLVDHP